MIAMGLGANEDGHFSMCDATYLQSWGAHCLAYKGAIEQCTKLNIDISEYKSYLELNLVRYSKDLPKIPTPPGDESGAEVKDEKVADLYRDQIKQLTAVNLQQKAQIESLIKNQSSHQIQVQPAIVPPPVTDPTQANVLQQKLDRLNKLESRDTGHQRAVPGVLSAAAAVNTANTETDSPAVAAMGQMANAMAQLSLSIDPSSGSKAGQFLRPEYHYCVLERGMPIKSAEASKLSINEYLYGMCLVLEHLIDPCHILPTSRG